eukprot:CAMPEP_0179187238 /NCGR_PEP_ID=MMETSP0796-20121207/92906_1 /TAXON_ID=73915 /ORGANISM="Pyrodinium bahamense, Strain pbaha01" /LENGTH=224 /DNA_ID=CAMNT_0020891301 /DNA_START=11 /DNA_END=682 /DNA_ORIENTATION=-
MSSVSSASMATPVKRKRVGSKAHAVLDSIGYVLTQEQHERDLAEIMTHLRQHTDKIVRVKAFLASSLSAGFKQEHFVRGVLTLGDVPYKHQKAILCQACEWELSQVVNMPKAKTYVHWMFIWASGTRASWKLPAKEMRVEEFSNLYKQMYRDAGNRLANVNLAEDMDWCFDYGEFRLLKNPDGSVSHIKKFNDEDSDRKPLPFNLTIQAGEISQWGIVDNYDET